MSPCLHFYIFCLVWEPIGIKVECFGVLSIDLTAIYIWIDGRVCCSTFLQAKNGSEQETLGQEECKNSSKIGIDWPTDDGMNPEEILVATSKIDWMAFAIFIAFYSMFNFIYFCVTITFKWCFSVKTFGCWSRIKSLIVKDWKISST